MPGSSSILLIGSDGGAFSTSNADIAGTGTPTFVNMDNGLNTIEFYSGDISGYFATSPNPSAAGGAQDNAPSVVGFSGYPTGPAQWQMTVGGDGFYARIDPVGTGLSPRYFVGNNSGGMSRCVTNCLAGGGRLPGRHRRLGRRHAVVHPALRPLPRRSAGRRRLCSGRHAGWVRSPRRRDDPRLGVDQGRRRQHELGSWYVTNNPATQNMTKQSLGNRSFINQVKYSPKWSSQAIVGTNDGNVWIGFNLGTGIASQANWVNVTGSNTVLPNRPVLGIALDASTPTRDLAVGYAAIGGFDENTPSHPGTCLPGDLRLELRNVHVARQDGQPAQHPGRLDHPEPRTSRRRSSPGPTGACTTRTTSPPRRRPGSDSTTACRTR